MIWFALLKVLDYGVIIGIT